MITGEQARSRIAGLMNLWPNCLGGAGFASGRLDSVPCLQSYQLACEFYDHDH